MVCWIILFLAIISATITNGENFNNNENILKRLEKLELENDQLKEDFISERAKLKNDIIFEKNERLKLQTKLQTKMDLLQASLTEISTDIFHAKNDTGSIAFAAELTHTIGPNAAYGIVPYGREIMNIGVGYSITSYTFTALIKGPNISFPGRYWQRIQIIHVHFWF